MQRLLSPQFKMRYLVAEKAAIFTGLMSFFMFCKEPVPMKPHGCLDTLPEPSNTGFIVASPMDLLDCGRVTGRDVLVAYPPQIYTSYETSSRVHPETWDTSKTSGMGYYYHTILPKNTLFRSAYANARGCSTNLDSASRDLAANRVRPILNYRISLKKLLPVDERPRYPAVVRGRSPFPTARQPDTNVGAQGTAAPSARALVPRQSGLLRSTRSQDREIAGQRSSHFQRRDIRRLCSLSSAVHSRENLPHSGQCEMAQSKSFERVILHESRPHSPDLLSTLFSRTQPGGKSLENNPQTGHTQSFFPFGRRASPGSHLLFLH